MKFSTENRLVRIRSDLKNLASWQRRDLDVVDRMDQFAGRMALIQPMTPHEITLHGYQFFLKIFTPLKPGRTENGQVEVRMEAKLNEFFWHEDLLISPPNNYFLPGEVVAITTAFGWLKEEDGIQVPYQVWEEDGCVKRFTIKCVKNVDGAMRYQMSPRLSPGFHNDISASLLWPMADFPAKAKRSAVLIKPGEEE